MQVTFANGTTESTSTELSIIIVNWNSVEFLRKCIASVKAETTGVVYEIVVIDSASFDGCDRMLREEYPEVQFIQGTKNVGFGRANNAAFKVSRGRCLLFLNPDTEVLSSAIGIMYSFLQTLPTAGAVGCKLLNADRSLQTSCIQSFPTILNQVLDTEWLRRRWPKSVLWGMAPLFADSFEPKVVEAIAGACVMMKREAFERVGLFSEEYFMYAEDIDLSYKLARGGYKNYYIPTATVVHYGGGSSQEAPSNFSVVMMRESIWRFLGKTRGRGYASLYRLSMLISALGRLAVLWVRQVDPSACRDRSTTGNSFSKWRAVLRWSLNRQEMVKQYD